MAFILANMLGESTLTVGEGSFSLTGAATGHRKFSSEMAVGDTVYYRAYLNSDQNIWEVGLGTYTAADILSRDTVYDSSNAGAKVPFPPGTKTVLSVLPAEYFAGLESPEPYATNAENAAEAAETAAAAATGAAAGINRINLFPDEFFQLTGNQFTIKVGGRDLYNQRNATWVAGVEHEAGIGAWRHPANGNLLGFNLDLNFPTAVEQQFGAGDVFSFGMMVRGLSAGGTVNAAHRFYNGDDGVNTTAQSGLSSIVTNGDTQVLAIENVTWPVGSDGITVYTWASGTLVEYDVLAVWFVRGPKAGTQPPVRRSNDILAKMISQKTSLSTQLNAVSSVAYLGTEITYASLTIDKAASGVYSGNSRDLPFAGWADTYETPVSATWDAVRLLTLGRALAANPKMTKIKIVVKTHATNATDADATLLAVGETKVDPDVSPLANTLILLRDSATGLPKRITQADMLGDTLVGYYTTDDAGNPAACSEIGGTVAGLTHRQSYYHAGGNPLTTGWAPFSGNPTLGLEMVSLTGAASSDKYFPKKTWLDAEAEKLKLSGQISSRSGRINGSSLVKFRRFQHDRNAGSPKRMVMGFVGDSWTATATYYLSVLAPLLLDRFGDGGIGYCSMGFPSLTGPDWNNSGADARNEYARTYSAGWTSNYRAGSTSPDCSDIRSSTAGARFTLRNGGSNTNPPLSGAKLHFTGTADGVIRWRWNGGYWSANTNVQGGVGAQQFLDLTGFPTTALNNAAAATRQVEIEVVSGSVILCGVDLQSSTDGVVLHKLGSSGATAQSFMANTAAQWQAGIASLGCDFFGLLFATNEQAQGQAPDLFANYMLELAGRCRSATPGCDLLLSTPPENVTVTSVAMPSYAGALSAASSKLKGAILDLQPAFGRANAPAEYGPASSYPLIRADPHPDTVDNRGPIALASEIDTMLRLG
jgi:hypothetical protein